MPGESCCAQVPRGALVLLAFNGGRSPHGSDQVRRATGSWRWCRSATVEVDSLTGPSASLERLVGWGGSRACPGPGMRMRP